MDTERMLKFHGVRDWFLSDEIAFESSLSYAGAGAQELLGLEPSSASSSISSTPSSASVDRSIKFRPIQPHDREVIQTLHEEWFPVTYHDEFYDDLVRNGQQQWCARKQGHYSGNSHGGDGYPTRSLYTCLAVRNDEEDASICACIVGCSLNASRLSPRLQSLLLPSHHTTAFYIMTLGVVPECRKEGLGSRMVQLCERLVEQDENCGVLYLHVITYNHAAIRLYEKLGFYRVEEIENYYFIDGKPYNAFLFAKYFHGNRGHRDIFAIVKASASVILKQLVSAFPLLLRFLPQSQRNLIQQQTL